MAVNLCFIIYWIKLYARSRISCTSEYINKRDPLHTKLFSMTPYAQKTVQIFFKVKNQNRIAIWTNLRLFFFVHK